MSDPHHIILTDQEIDEILEPIEGHDHCWGFIAQHLISKEIERRKRESKKLGPYGDWPVDVG